MSAAKLERVVTSIHHFLCGVPMRWVGERRMGRKSGETLAIFWKFHNSPSPRVGIMQVIPR